MAARTKNRDVCEVAFCLEPTRKQRMCVKHYNANRKQWILANWGGGEDAIVYGPDGLIDEMASYRKRANKIDAKIKYLWEHQTEIQEQKHNETTALDATCRRMFEENQAAMRDGTLELLVEARRKAGVV